MRTSTLLLLYPNILTQKLRLDNHHMSGKTDLDEWQVLWRTEQRVEAF